MGVGVLIQITPQLRILVAIEAIDGRKGIDSLAQLCRECVWQLQLAHFGSLIWPTLGVDVSGRGFWGFRPYI